MISADMWLLAGKISLRVSAMDELMEIMGQTYPKEKRFMQLKEQLAQGNNLQDILSDSGYEGKLKAYLAKISFKQATTVLYYQNKYLVTLVKQFLKSIGYQLVILVMSLFVLSLFTNKVLPMMIETVITDKTISIYYMFKVINIVKDVILILLLVMTLFILYILRSKKETYLWMFLHKFKLDKNIRVIVTYLFVSDLIIYLENGIELDKAIQLIRYNKTNRMVSLLAYHFNDDLLEGNDILHSLKNEYFDDQFYTFCYFGISNNEFLSSLEDYKLLIQEKTNRIIKNVALTIQVISYGFVTAVILLAYQALMLPLELLEGI